MIVVFVLSNPLFFTFDYDTLKLLEYRRRFPNTIFTA